MNKRIPAALLAAAIAALTGCGNAAQQTATAETTAAQTEEAAAETTSAETTAETTAAETESAAAESDSGSGERTALTQEEIEDFNHRFYTNNLTDAVLARHTSVDYTYDNDYPNSKDKAYFYHVTADGMYAEGDDCAQYGFDRIVLLLDMVPGEEYDYPEMQYIMDFSRNYSSHPNCYLPDYEDEWFDAEHETLTDGYKQDGKIYLFTECDEEGSRKYIENTVGEEYKGQIIRCDLEFEEDSLDLICQRTISVVDGVPETIQTISAEYDTPEPKNSHFLKMAFSRAAYQFMTVTYIYEPDTPHEMTLSLEVPKNVSVGFIADNRTDFTVYTDRECTQPLTDWDGMTDITAYIKTDSTEEETEADAEAGTETETEAANETETENAAEE